MPTKKFRRALVVRGGALGDFLLTLPALSALRGAAGHLEVLAYPQFVQLARETGLTDGGRSIEYGPLSGFFARGAVQDPELREYLASFDVVLSYLYDPDGIFAANVRAAGVAKFVQGPHRPGGTIHAVDELATPLRGLQIPLATRAIKLPMPPPEQKNPLVALHPGSGSAAKNWPKDRWLALAAGMLAAEEQRHVAIIGGEADDAAIDTLAPLRGNARVQWWENLPLADLATRLAGASAYVGHDTGVSHLAAVLGVPSLLLFGPTDPAVWAPPHGHVAVLRAPGGNLEHLEPGAVVSAVKHHFPATRLASTSEAANNSPW